LIFARTRRPTVLLALAAAGVAAALLAAGGWRMAVGEPAGAALLGLAAIFAIAFAVRDALRLRRWPAATIAFFEDALIVRSGRHEVRAPWDRIGLVTLAAPSEWTDVLWPEVRLTDRLTIRMRGGATVRLHPASFGLDPVACRDLVLRMRDEPAARSALPAFDSVLDLVVRRPAVGELMKPRL
jgi:hypothetical protein